MATTKKKTTTEKVFDTVFGLYAQECYYTPIGRGVYTSGSSDEKTLNVNKLVAQKINGNKMIICILTKL